jgi:hypothetical protein
MTSQRTGPSARPSTALSSAVALVVLSLSSACMHGASVRPSSDARPAAAPVTEREAEARAAPPVETATAVIVQGTDLASVAAAVRAVGGEITHELGIIDAVGARLTPSQIAQLEADETLNVQADGTVGVSDTNVGAVSSKR